MSKNKSKIQDTCDQQEPSSVSSGRYLDKVIGFSRDENGFLNGVEYIFNTDCTINWRAMIKPEHLVPNRDSFKDSNINLKEIRCAFVILKKQAKQGKHCELFAISVGDVTIKRNLKMVTDMVTSVKKGIALKNRNSCLYCDYHNTEHCK